MATTVFVAVDSSGTWELFSDDGTTYELDVSKVEALDTEGQRVSVTGKFREDVMTMAMIESLLEVEPFEVAK